MKLIIDIPNNIYDAIKKTQTIISGQRSGKTLLQILVNSVENGTPLDSVIEEYVERGAITENMRMLYKIDSIKAEIKELRDSWEKDCYHDEAEALDTALRIIDKHMRGTADETDN